MHKQRRNVTGPKKELCLILICNSGMKNNQRQRKQRKQEVKKQNGKVNETGKRLKTLSSILTEDIVTNVTGIVVNMR